MHFSEEFVEIANGNKSYAYGLGKAEAYIGRLEEFIEKGDLEGAREYIEELYEDERGVLKKRPEI